MNALDKPLLATGTDPREARLALRLAARLNESARQLDPDLSERLRISREHAVERARQIRATRAAGSRSGLTAAGAAILGGGWWSKLGAAIPLAALVLGLMLIEQLQLDEQITAAAEIDVSLLSDDVPPTAYSDPGFVEFLKTPSN